MNTPSLFRRATFAAVAFAATFAGNRDASAQEVSINFNNRSGEEVHVFWSDPQGKETRYLVLKPNGAALQQTAVGHNWVFRRPNGTLLGGLTATRTTEHRFDPPARPVGNPGNPLPGQAPAAEVPPNGQPRPAPASPATVPAGTPTNITWKNGSQDDVEVFWVPDAGAERSYGVIKPGAEFRLMAAVGYKFVLRDTATRGEVGRTTVTGLDQKILFAFNRADNAANPNPNAPQPRPQGQPLPQGQAQPQGAATAQTEAAKAIQYLNMVRANPGQFQKLHASLADADVQPRPALAVNKALMAAAERKARWMAENERDDFSQFAHVITFNSERTGMNKWMREAGYPLAPLFKDDETNFECLAFDGGFGMAGFGQRQIDGFLAEGKNGGHVLPILGRGFWAPCKDIGVGVAVSAKGNIYMSLLVGIYNPLNPEQQAP